MKAGPSASMLEVGLSALKEGSQSSLPASPSVSMLEVGTLLAGRGQIEHIEVGMWLEGGNKSIPEASPSASMLEVGLLALKARGKQVSCNSQCWKWVPWLEGESKLSATASSSAFMMEVDI